MGGGERERSRAKKKSDMGMSAVKMDWDFRVEQFSDSIGIIESMECVSVCVCENVYINKA